MESKNLFYQMVDVNILSLPGNLATILSYVFLLYLVIFILAIFIKKLRHFKLSYMSIILIFLFVTTVLANVHSFKREYSVKNWTNNICFEKLVVPFPYALDKKEQQLEPPLTINKLSSSSYKYFFAEEVLNMPKDITLDKYCELRANLISKNVGGKYQIHPFKSINITGIKTDFFMAINSVISMDDNSRTSSDFTFQINEKIYTFTCNGEPDLGGKDIDFILSQIRRL